MRDDELMDALLKDTMAAPAPQLSMAFDARVMQRVKPRTLSSMGRTVLAIYVVAATGLLGWLVRDMPLVWISGAVVASVAVAMGTGAYVRRIALGHPSAS